MRLDACLVGRTLVGRTLLALLASGALVPALAAGEPSTLAFKAGKAVMDGNLKAEDDKDKLRKQPCKIATVTCKKGWCYQFDMTSKELDSYLRLEDGTGKELASDDDSGGLVHARIRFQCRVDGTYRVICTTFAGGTGPFTLTVHESALAKPMELPWLAGTAKVDGKLTSTDATDVVQARSVCKIYAIQLAKGKAYQIDMQSKEVDAYLRLEDAAGKELARDDDSGGGRDARIRFTCPEAGAYRIIASTYRGGTGRFTLSVKQQ